MKSSALQKLPRSVIALCWVLAGCQWRFKLGGATHRALKLMLNIDSKDGVRALVRRAEECGVVKVRYTAVTHRPVVALRADAFRALTEGMAACLKD